MREIVLTRDGSPTISIPEKKLTYHSIHGALQESRHVYIEAGLNYLLNRSIQSPIRLFEMGFGTGLNAFLTAIRAQEATIPLQYTAIETTPLSFQEAMRLDYPVRLGHKALFEEIHHSNWNEEIKLREYFTLKKLQTNLLDYTANQTFHCIYYDAFAPSAQPELWTKEIVEKLLSLLVPNGILVTYCSKGDVRRAMIGAGFSVKRLPGPPGKREMLRCEKLVAK